MDSRNVCSRDDVGTTRSHHTEIITHSIYTIFLPTTPFR